MILINKAEQYIAKIIFRNHILTYSGQQFEDFFVSIMRKSNPSFYSVKAYGNIGDEKNDGFDRTTGTYYQIFAPEDLHKDQMIKIKASHPPYIKLSSNLIRTIMIFLSIHSLRKI